MLVEVYNPRTKKVEIMPHPFATMSDCATLIAYYNSRGLEVAAFRTVDVVL